MQPLRLITLIYQSDLFTTNSLITDHQEMKVTDYFETANGQTLISFEVLPPLKGGSMKAIFDTLDPLMEFKPPFIDVT